MASIGKVKNYKKKTEMSRIAYTSYNKVLVELRSALRGDEFNKRALIDRTKIMDEIIIDQIPLVDKFVKKYKKSLECNKKY